LADSISHLRAINCWRLAVTGTGTYTAYQQIAANNKNKINGRKSNIYLFLSLITLSRDLAKIFRLALTVKFQQCSEIKQETLKNNQVQ